MGPGSSWPGAHRRNTIHTCREPLMTSALLTTVIVLIALSCLNFTLTMGIVRQLRTQGERPPQPDRDLLGATGRRVGDFTVATMRGDRLSREELRPYTIVAFFLPGCPGCE